MSSAIPSPDELSDAAVRYAEQRAWHVFPLKRRSKDPYPGSHGHLDARADPAVVRSMFATRPPGSNIGLSPGPSGLVIIDEDGPDARAFLRTLGLDDPPTTLCATTGRADGGRHWYFQRPDFEVGNRRDNAHDINVRCDKGYVVLPPSIHPDGPIYTWIDAALAPQPLPPAVIDWLRTLLGTPARDEPPNATPAVGRISVGGRHTWLIGQAGALRRRGVEPEGLAAALAALNRVECDPPLPESEVSAVAAYVARKPTDARMLDPVVDIVTPEYPDGAPWTDVFNAQRFARFAADDVRYVRGPNCWFVWDGTRWYPESDRRHPCVTRLAKDLTHHALRVAAERRDEDLMKAVVGLQRAAKLEDMIDLAHSEPGILTNISVFDCEPWIFTVANGAVDVRTGTFREARREDLVTKRSPVTYDAEARAPAWDRCLREWFPVEDGTREVFQRFCGYLLTGSVREQKFLVIYGPGENGKSTVMRTLLQLLGDYGVTLPFEVLASGSRHSPGAASPHLVVLRGARLAVATEGESVRLNEALVKSLTGDDRISARALYQAPITFDPQFKLVLVTNSLPIIRGTNHAIWRRIAVVPFCAVPALRDPQLIDRLRAESSGILNWALTGARAWQAEGLGSSMTIETASAQYREREDTVGQWLDLECETDLTYYAEHDPTTADPAWRETHAQLYAAYRRWCGAAGWGEGAAASATHFGKVLEGRGYRTWRSADKATWRLGLRLTQVARDAANRFRAREAGLDAEEAGSDAQF